MSTLGWAPSLIVAIVTICALLWVFGEIAHTFGTRDDHDWLADYKRKLDRNAQRQRWGGR